MTAIRVVGLRKVFGDVSVVDDVSFQVESGSILTLLGPSGCGKTTTLRMIAGLQRPDAGEIYVGRRSAISANSAGCVTGYLVTRLALKSPRPFR